MERLGGFAALELVISTYVLTPNQGIVFDVKAWGWITLILGAIIFLVGLALAGGAGQARWTAIALIAINLFEQLGRLGSTAYPLWTLTVITIGFLALYGLTVRWGDNQPGATSA